MNTCPISDYLNSYMYCKIYVTFYPYFHFQQQKRKTKYLSSILLRDVFNRWLRIICQINGFCHLFRKSCNFQFRISLFCHKTANINQQDCWLPISQSAGEYVSIIRIEVTWQRIYNCFTFIYNDTFTQSNFNKNSVNNVRIYLKIIIKNEYCYYKTNKQTNYSYNTYYTYNKRRQQAAQRVQHIPSNIIIMVFHKQ